MTHGAQLLESWLARQHWSQTDLATELQVAPAGVCRWLPRWSRGTLIRGPTQRPNAVMRLKIERLTENFVPADAWEKQSV